MLESAQKSNSLFWGRHLFYLNTSSFDCTKLRSPFSLPNGFYISYICKWVVTELKWISTKLIHDESKRLLNLKWTFFSKGPSNPSYLLMPPLLYLNISLFERVSPFEETRISSISEKQFLHKLNLCLDWN
jgi:hypothetical protein